ncbi:hypothetical protein [Fischerella sp. FACHB-380]|uniref:hypothetical protein n=1 Tax=Fischerella sp. FACHB-380 TaxID=2692799 RepID=UPI001683E74F|nr:hypothetical protein [Fischerella sp. FACHB-380]MBD2431033.1 hypothetical protein [Fischerella sp. FACHB-380]
MFTPHTPHTSPPPHLPISPSPHLPTTPLPLIPTPLGEWGPRVPHLPTSRLPSTTRSRKNNN